ncbi:MAG: SUMF1/EgtB/PvdO family nonheme iron enzyme [Oligosphaeraceae bacterium]
MTTRKRGFFVLAAIVWLSSIVVCVAAEVNSEAKMHKYSTVVEKERPELDEETRRLIAEYRRNPTEANRAALRRQVELRYDGVVARKKAKLEELRQTAKDPSKVEEMRVIVEEMLRDRESRIEQSMRRFADPRLKPDARTSADGFLPVIGGPQNLSIAYAPVTNSQYAAFAKATGRPVPKDWEEGACPAGKEEHPVVNVSCQDAIAYCQWLTATAGQGRYRLPTAEEWEIAAGHMPKDADFNCGENPGTTPVTRYASTQAACGAVDMWGNVWEWTSTMKAGDEGKPPQEASLAVKGGAWNSPRTSCRTEAREEFRLAVSGYETVGFRVVREL